MRIGASLFLIALGAILDFAVNRHVNGVNLNLIGLILMIVGIIGLVVSLMMMGMRRRTDVVYRREAGAVMEPVDPRY
ncbi:MAG: hypothetical protein JO147_04800 [Actinobacteria bacterium]|nr:hypothetical protein [Actinomycetota bacterium]